MARPRIANNFPGVRFLKRRERLPPHAALFYFGLQKLQRQRGIQLELELMLGWRLPLHWTVRAPIVTVLEPRSESP